MGDVVQSSVVLGLRIKLKQFMASSCSKTFYGKKKKREKLLLLLLFQLVDIYDSEIPRTDEIKIITPSFLNIY